MSIVKGKGGRSDPAYDEAVQRGIDALMALARLLKVDSERVTAQARISQPMAAVLSRLRLLPDQTTVSELARAIGCNMGNLSGTLDRLAETGHIERVVGEADRRARFIRLTAKGRRTATQLIEDFQSARVCTALKAMSVQQLDAFTETTNRIVRAAATDEATSAV
jgi:DNA-binding MarR family transcriptional regulator